VHPFDPARERPHEPSALARVDLNFKSKMKSLDPVPLATRLRVNLISSKKPRLSHLSQHSAPSRQLSAPHAEWSVVEVAIGGAGLNN
jgi:hypothetical protein